MTMESLRSTLGRGLMLDRNVDFWLGELNARWSVRETRARVVSVVSETPDAKTFVLRPNAGWRGHRAGQFTTVEVEIDGVRTRRCYSIASPPGAPLLAITVKRARGGLVSGWLHDHVRRGDVLRLGPAAGDFVLPEPTPARLLLLSGGSGITPVMSIARDLAARGALGDVVMLHHARSRADVIFRRELEARAARHPGLRLIFALDDEADAPGRPFEASRLRRLVPDFASRETFLCGPPGLMEKVERLWEREGATSRLRHERFVAAPPPPVVAEGSAAGALVTLTRSGRTVPVATSGTLLTELERAGERPAHGCRMGICQTCRCRKQSGTIQNLRTGAVSSAPDEDIQLCVSVARSDVTLGL